MSNNHIKITYTNNCGLLFVYGGVKILIDALEEDINTFDSPPLEVRDYIQENVFNKQGKNILLFTHCHDDHFSDSRTFFASREGIDLVVLPEDKKAVLCQKEATTHHNDKFIMLPQGCKGKEIVLQDDIRITMIKTEHLHFRGIEACQHYAIILDFAGEKYFIAGDSDPDCMAQVMTEYIEKVSVAFFNPVVLGRPKTMDLLTEKFCDEIVIYHLPSEETDKYGYRRMANTMAKKYIRDEKVKVNLLLNKLDIYKG